MLWGVLLILLGLLLLAAEVFIPSGGLILILALTAMASGVVMIFYTPESEGGGVNAGLISLLFLVVLSPLLVGVLLYYWQYSPMNRVLRLNAPKEDTSLAASPAVLELEQYRNQIAKTLTPHMPSGQVEVFGKRVDAVSESGYLEAGAHVRVVGIRQGHLIVRPAGAETFDLPPDLLT